MTSYLRRLLRTGAAYQLADAVSKVVALALLPIYTRHLTRADYGTAELLLTTIILVSIVLRLGLGEALVRFHFLDADPERRRRLARTATGTLFVATTLAAGAAAIVGRADQSRCCSAPTQPDVIRAAALGLWAFTNLELAYALLRVEERARAFAHRLADQRRRSRSSLTVWLVVVRDAGRARACCSATTSRRRRRADRPVVGRSATRSGSGRAGSTGPARPDAALRAADRARRGLGVRAVLHRPLLAVPLREPRPRRACTRSRSSSPASSSSPCARSSTRGRRWPTRSWTTRRRAASTPASRPTTCSSRASSSPGWSLLGRWLVRLFAAPEFFAAHEALPWVALGWALYGLFLVLVAMAGRAQVTVRNAPAALCGPGRQRRAARAARPAAGHRRRRPGAGGRLRR